MKTISATIKGALFLLLCINIHSAMAQFPLYGWRGPQRNGIYNESGLLKEWPAEGPQKLWETSDVGKGNSSPTVTDKYIFVTGMNDDASMETLSAYTLEGKKIYTVEYSKPWHNTYPETRTTPAYSDGKVYAIGGCGDIVCLNAADGKEIWRVAGSEAYKRKINTYGTCESPLVFDDKVIYSPAGEEATMVALDKKNGKEIWRSSSLDDCNSYASPIVIKHKGKKQIIGATASKIFGVNAKNGEIEWDFTIKKGHHGDVGNPTINSPIFKDGKVFFSQGYDIGSYMLQLSDDLKSATLLWSNDQIDTHMGGYVELGNTIYSTTHINNGMGNWYALDWETGDVLYNEAWTGKSKGAIIAADNMLYCYEERRGTVALVKPSREKFEIVSEFRITSGEGPHWAHPVIANGVLYIRHGSTLIAYKIK